MSGQRHEPDVYCPASLSSARDTHDRLVREIAVNAEAAVVFVDDDRSPETRYPIAIEPAYAANRAPNDSERNSGPSEFYAGRP
jgi:alpha/beta hydrolase fold